MDKTKAYAASPNSNEFNSDWGTAREMITPGKIIDIELKITTINEDMNTIAVDFDILEIIQKVV